MASEEYDEDLDDIDSDYSEYKHAYWTKGRNKMMPEESQYIDQNIRTMEDKEYNPAYDDDLNNSSCRREYKQVYWVEAENKKTVDHLKYPFSRRQRLDDKEFDTYRACARYMHKKEKEHPDLYLECSPHFKEIKK